MSGSPDAGPDALALMPKAPRTLAEALDMLQPFLPTDRAVTLFSKVGGATIGVTTGGPSYTDEITGYSHKCAAGASLSAKLAAAEAEHAALWQAKHGPVAIAEAEFGPYCARVSA